MRIRSVTLGSSARHQTGATRGARCKMNSSIASPRNAGQNVKSAISRPRSRLVRGLIGATLFLTLSAGFAAWKLRGESPEAAIARDFRDRRFTEASRRIDAWKAAEPRSAEPEYWKARLALVHGQAAAFSAALKEAEGLGLERSRSDLLKMISTALSGRFSEVELLLRDNFNANALGDPDPLVMDALALGYLSKYDMPRAALVINRWITACPNDPAPYLRRAEIDMRKSDGKALIVDYREALKRDPGLSKARLGLAEALREAHQVDEAAAVVAEYLKSNDSDAAGHLCAGRTALERSLPAEAIGQLQRAIALAPENALAHKSLGDALLRDGDPAKALGELEKAKSLDPFDLEVRHNLGLALARLDRKDDAKKEQETAARFRAELQTMLSAQAKLMKAPADLASRVVICRWMFEHGKPEQGRLWAESILKDHPGEPDASRLLAEHYDAAGKQGLANYHRLQAKQVANTPRAQESRKPEQSVESSQPLR